ncbi:carbohydrate-binding protein [Tasmannia lanceolata]|uniref:carbohydrate-binding protein n=1 Tax=Tasmannia lanceolata TaxID=3420 RepID=UPI004064801C
MEIQLLKSCFDFSKRRKKFLLLLTAFGLSSYGFYKIYQIPSVVKKRKQFFKLLETLISVSESVSGSAETIGIISKDLKEFLQSDSDEIPTSLKQISKLAKSDEFSSSLIRVSQALAIGILRGYSSETKNSEESMTRSSLSDRILDKLFSTAGSGFASIIVGSFARNLVMGFYSNSQSVGSLNLDDQMNWVNLICNDKCRGLIADCIQLFVSTLVTVYLDKTMNINTYDEIFSGMTNQKHDVKVKDMLVSVCNSAIETLVKTSHQVLTNSNSSSLVKANSDSSLPQSPMRIEGFEHQSRSSFDEIKDSGWVDKVSSTLAVPRNRRFVLDVTGRVIFESVRSFLDYLLWKLLDGLKTGRDFVHREFIEKGLEVMKYIGAKSVFVITVCIALCLHVLVGVTVMVPA